jgi:hypothetical protein
MLELLLISRNALSTNNASKKCDAKVFVFLLYTSLKNQLQFNGSVILCTSIPGSFSPFLLSFFLLLFPS